MEPIGLEGANYRSFDHGVTMFVGADVDFSHMPIGD